MQVYFCVTMFLLSEHARQVIVKGETPVVEVENSTSPVTMRKTVDISSPAVREKQSHFRFLTVITLACLGMLLFVCVFSLVQLLKRINSCNLSVSASYKIREKTSSGHTEDDYVRMKPGVTRVTSSAHERSLHQQPHQTSPAGGSMNIPEIDPCYLGPFIAVNAPLDPDYIDLSTPRLSSVYENLRDDFLQESVYHTVEVTSI
ncbi:uncharacterized protein [Salminus brasiliensis]|uniref:uncharacterized protein n=1 Tax=Salminus brasiliensis TaxID=930266 RepID=UPI003B832A80